MFTSAVCFANTHLTVNWIPALFYPFQAFLLHFSSLHHFDYMSVKFTSIQINADPYGIAEIQDSMEASTDDQFEVAGIVDFSPLTTHKALS